jgi:hypothetical protein
MDTLSHSKSRCIIETKCWVHDFLDDKDNILRYELKGDGKAFFKIVDISWVVLVNDYILTRSKNGKKKVIYKIVQVEQGEGRIRQGIMEDLVGLNKADTLAEQAILLMDKDVKDIYGPVL